MAGKLLLGDREIQRRNVLEEVKGKRMPLKEAAARLHISYKQAQRIFKRYSREGPEGLISRKYGMVKNHIDYGIKEKAIEICKKYYGEEGGMGAKRAAEKLEAENNIKIRNETLRRWLFAEGILERKRRRACFGELVKFEIKMHDWFEGRRGGCYLIKIEDDATGKSIASLFEQGGEKEILKVLSYWIKRNGIPQEIYCNGNSFKLEECFYFKKACKKLGIGIIEDDIREGQKKEERNRLIWEELFVKEMSARGIEKIEEANWYLSMIFLPDINKKYKRRPHSKQNGHIALGDINLKSIINY